MSSPTIDQTTGGNWKRLLEAESDEASFLKADLERAESRLVPFTPYTPEERQKALASIKFHPHGLYLPADHRQAAQLKAVLDRIGDISNDHLDLRLSKYYELQARTEQLQQRGVPGQWTGQQAVVRSPKRFRLVAWARRGGKTSLASAEAVAYALHRPRSVVWLAAPIMDLVARGFDMVVRMLRDLGVSELVHRDSAQAKLVVLENGSRIEGISLENIPSVAGAAVDFAVIDEAAQIDPRAWYRAIVPPLMDRDGQALLISSFEGAEGFFYEKSREQGSDHWEIFTGASYDLNFFAFPKGIKTPALIQAQKEMPKLEFLEQFGAIPLGVRDRVWPEFRSRVHVGRYGFDAARPIILSADPSGGGSPYAVVAIQDYGEWFKVIDEFYQPYVTTEYVAGELDKRPWRDNVTEVIVDPAHPDEATRWTQLGYPALGSWEKPQIADRLPLHRNALRDPGRFHELYRILVNQILSDGGLDENADLDMDPRDQYAYYLQVEEMLSDSKMTEEMQLALKKCSRLFINIAACPNTVMEHEKYRYPKKRQTWLNLKEKPADAYNHCMDAIGYFLWIYKRFDKAFTDGDFSYLAPSGLRGALPVEDDGSLQAVRLDTPVTRSGLFLDHLRTRYTPLHNESFMRPARHA